MNITLSAEKALIEKSRALAQKHNTSLNQMIRDYLTFLVDQGDLRESAEEFEKLALGYSGKSPEGFRFSRDAIYSRGR